MRARERDNVEADDLPLVFDRETEARLLPPECGRRPAPPTVSGSSFASGRRGSPSLFACFG